MSESGRDFVLIHGAWAGPWVWDSILPALLSAGHRPRAVTVPGTGDDAADDPTFDQAVEGVIAQLTDLDADMLLVGHSGGGAVATQVAERLAGRVAGVAFVAGMMLPSGRGYHELCQDAGLLAPVGINAYLEYDRSRTVSTVPPAAAATIFFHGADPADAIAAAARMTPQGQRALVGHPTWTAERFGRIPRLYLEAVADRTVPLAVQREMQRQTPGASRVTMESDHAPMLSDRAGLTAALLEFSNGLR